MGRREREGTAGKGGLRLEGEEPGASSKTSNSPSSLGPGIPLPVGRSFQKETEEAARLLAGLGNLKRRSAWPAAWEWPDWAGTGSCGRKEAGARSDALPRAGLRPGPRPGTGPPGQPPPALAASEPPGGPLRKWHSSGRMWKPLPGAAGPSSRERRSGRADGSGCGSPGTGGPSAPLSAFSEKLVVLVTVSRLWLGTTYQTSLGISGVQQDPRMDSSGIGGHGGQAGAGPPPVR